MKHDLRAAASGAAVLKSKRADPVQVAALCYRETSNGKQVLLITSRDTGRWIVPKGWPIEGKNGAESALQEAWEEAGVKKAEVEQEPIGSYAYDKGLDDGASVEIQTHVYLTKVKELSEEYPEAEQRQREWIAPGEAANRVDEPELRDILKAFSA